MDNHQTLTGNWDVDTILLARLEPKSFEATSLITKTHLIISKNQLFWKLRLEERLGLYSDDLDLDYESIIYFLDKGKTFEENNLLAKRRNLINVTN